MKAKRRASSNSGEGGRNIAIAMIVMIVLLIFWLDNDYGCGLQYWIAIVVLPLVSVILGLIKPGVLPRKITRIFSNVGFIRKVVWGSSFSLLCLLGFYYCFPPLRFDIEVQTFRDEKPVEPINSCLGKLRLLIDNRDILEISHNGRQSVFLSKSFRRNARLHLRSISSKEEQQQILCDTVLTSTFIWTHRFVPFDIIVKDLRRSFLVGTCDPSLTEWKKAVVSMDSSFVAVSDTASDFELCITMNEPNFVSGSYGAILSRVLIKAGDSCSSDTTVKTMGLVFNADQARNLLTKELNELISHPPKSLVKRVVLCLQSQARNKGC